MSYSVPRDHLKRESNDGTHSHLWSEMVFVNWCERDGVIMTVWPQAVYAKNIWRSFFNKVSHSFSFHLKKTSTVSLWSGRTHERLVCTYYSEEHKDSDAAVGQEHEWVRGQTVLCGVKEGSESFWLWPEARVLAPGLIIGKAWLLHGPCYCACEYTGPSKVKQHTQFKHMHGRNVLLTSLLSFKCHYASERMPSWPRI